MSDLKNYQKITLGILEQYLDIARQSDVETAFHKFSDAQYKRIEGLENIPYVCLKLPTGAGKTFLAAHTINVVTNTYINKDYPTVLWLCPTNLIRKQTVESLKNPKHRNRQIIDSYFGGNVKVFDIKDFVEPKVDFSKIRPNDLKNNVCIIVATFQSFRIEETDGRRLYDHNENLETHFRNLENINKYNFERNENGEVKYSFANLMHLYRPIVIADEAHKNNSKLGYEMLNRLNPSCIVEYTATPTPKSNILYSVLAQAVKAEEMIKLPIILTEHQTWQESVTASIICRQKLAKLAENDEKYIRPIVLIQAEDKNKEITVEVIKNYLIKDENIDSDKIKIATGDQRELDDVDVMSKDCKVEYIITKEALKEGWDCPFAYILCSVTTTNSQTDVAQLLGRVMRMPYAKARSQEELNNAYAFVSTKSWTNAVSMLKDRLVEMGFNEDEAKQAIQAKLIDLETTKIESVPHYRYNAKTFNKDKLSEEIKDKVEIEETSIGVQITVKKENTTPEVMNEIFNNLDKSDREQAKETFEIFKFTTFLDRKSPASQGERIIVPQLSLYNGEEWEVADKREHFVIAPGKWLLEYPPHLTENDFAIKKTGEMWEINLVGNKITDKYIQETFALDTITDIKISQTVDTFAGWLVLNRPNKYLSRGIQLEFTRNIVIDLIENRKIPFEDLIKTKFILSEAIEKKIKEYEDKASETGMERTLFDVNSQVKTDFDFKITFGDKPYEPTRLYTDTIFEKHLYDKVHYMNSEEVPCALAIEMLKETKYWVRNIEKHQFSFSLPTSTDRFYPDFIVQLNDGRIFAIEYKGKPYITNDDSKEKIRIGELWERESNGKCLFKMVMVEQKDKNNAVQILKKVLEDKINNG